MRTAKQLYHRLMIDKRAPVPLQPFLPDFMYPMVNYKLDMQRLLHSTCCYTELPFPYPKAFTGDNATVYCTKGSPEHCWGDQYSAYTLCVLHVWTTSRRCKHKSISAVYPSLVVLKFLDCRCRTFKELRSDYARHMEKRLP